MRNTTRIKVLISNCLLTLLWLALAFGYPGYEFTAYTFGLGFDVGAARNDAFDLQLSLGAALGIPSMAFVDHFNILFVTVAPLCWWKNHKVQAIVRAHQVIESMSAIHQSVNQSFIHSINQSINAHMCSRSIAATACRRAAV